MAILRYSKTLEFSYGVDFKQDGFSEITDDLKTKTHPNYHCLLAGVSVSKYSRQRLIKPSLKSTTITSSALLRRPVAL